MRIAIIIPIYNCEKSLKKCLDAILCQLEPLDELIIVDDGSCDDSVLIAQQYQRVSLISHLENLGPANARNSGVELVKNAEIYCFIDSDVVIEKDCLKKIKSYFKEYSEVSAISTQVKFEKKNITNFASKYKSFYMNYILSQAKLEVNFLYGSCCAIRASDFILWPKDLRKGEDTFLGQLLSYENKKVHLLKEIENDHLKAYSLKSLIVNDFLVPFSFAKSFIFFNKNINKGTQNFSHTNQAQLIALSMIALSTFMFVLGQFKLMLFFLILNVLSNMKFYQEIYKENDIFFLLKSLLWTPLDQFIMGLGAFTGILWYKFVPAKES